MMAQPRVALVFVPQGEPSMPHLALPLLKGYLQTRLGVSADLFDLNLAFYRQLLSRDGVISLMTLLENGAGWPRTRPSRPIWRRSRSISTAPSHCWTAGPGTRRATPGRSTGWPMPVPFSGASIRAMPSP